MGSISSTLNSINASLLSEIQAFSTSGVSSRPTSAPAATEASASSDQINLSQAGTLFQQLRQLQTSNPAEFKQVLTDAAAKLQTAASQQTNPSAATFLDNLSSKFQTAATTGDLSALNPQSSSTSSSTGTAAGATHGHHGHHRGGGGDDDSTTSSTSSSQTTQDLLASILNSLGASQSDTQNNPQNNPLSSLSGGSSNNTLSSSNSGPSGSNSDQIQNLLAAFVTSGSGASPNL